MFIINKFANKESPIKTKSDLWRVLDERVFKKYVYTPFTRTSIGYFKQDCMELFKSYWDLRLMTGATFNINEISEFLNDYLYDRFWISKQVSDNISVISRLNTNNWKSNT